MKTHTEIGSEMLRQLPMHQNEPLVQTAYEICRWHHERYDGRGYPDGLSGDEIPIAAQAVALADVYDALTSTRVYKPAFTHEQAIAMILDGQCGTFSPMMMECLREIADTLPQQLERSSYTRGQEARIISEQQLHAVTAKASDRTLQLLDHERMKYSFFADMSEEIQFEYTISPSIVTLSSWGAKKLGLSEIIIEPHHNPEVEAVVSPEDLHNLADMLRSTTPEKPIVKTDYLVNLHGDKRWMQIISRAIWSQDEPPRYTGAIGKAVDIHDSYIKLMHLEWQTAHEALTGLLNYSFAKERICERINERTGGHFALIIADIDGFQVISRQHGREEGNRVLVVTAERLRQIIRSGDIAACEGSDEFLIFLEYNDDLESVVDRIFRVMNNTVGTHRISVSVGVASSDIAGKSYDELLRAADCALSTAKQDGGGVCRYYDPETMTVPRATRYPNGNLLCPDAGQEH